MLDGKESGKYIKGSDAWLAERWIYIVVILNNSNSMKRISSVSTVFRKKMIPVIVIILIFSAIIYCIFFNFVFNDIAILVFPAIILSVAWLYSFRNLKVVYLGNNYLEIENTKINFEDVVSINKVSLFRYEVKYRFGKSIEKFIFMVDSFPFVVPDYIKSIQNRIDKK